MTNMDIEELAKEAISDPNALGDLLEGLLSKKDEVRSASYNALLLVSGERGDVLYGRWDFIAGLLDSDNAYRRLIAVGLLADLASSDTEGRFQGILNKYYDLLDDSIIVAGHVAGNSAMIIKALPSLEERIVDRLLALERSTHKHRDLIKAYAIETFDEIYAGSGRKDEIMDFVKRQFDCKSPKTRKLAKSFVEKWEP
ncbi:MAG TPA: hypothetical protein PK718_04110 [Candidatus Methanofastidiosa archaeon]|nr:hypothetical protein [Candidatus Methanofastidiosa archaeon]